MTKIYFYKLTCDDLGAPCVQSDLLSLAICKPTIRSTADRGDIIFGFAANSLHPDNRLIYAVRVTEKLRDGEYYNDAQYSQRGDCIYRFEADGYVWKSGSQRHGKPEDLDRDLGK